MTIMWLNVVSHEHDEGLSKTFNHFLLWQSERIVLTCGHQWAIMITGLHKGLEVMNVNMYYVISWLLKGINALHQKSM